MNSRLVVLSTLVALLAACGGGSSGDEKITVKALAGKAASEGPGTTSPFGQVLFEGQPSSFAIGALTKISERRVNRTVFEYVMKVTVQNGGGDANDVSLSLKSVPAGITVIDGDLKVAQMTAGSTVIPSDTITIQVDRLAQYRPSSFVWLLQVTDGTVGVSEGIVTPNVPLNLFSLGVDFQDQAALSGTPVVLRRVRSPSMDELIDQDASVYQIVRRTSDTFEIQLDRLPSEPGLKVSIHASDFSQSDLNQSRLPIIMALSNPGDEGDEGEKFVSLETHTDPQTMKASATVPPAFLQSLPNGKFLLTLRLAVLKGFDAPISQSTKRIAHLSSSNVSKQAVSKEGVFMLPLDCPVNRLEGGVRTCVEVSMKGERIDAGGSKHHDGIDLRGNGEDVLGVPGGRVIAFRTVKDAQDLSAKSNKSKREIGAANTGAMVRLQEGTTTYDYYHLGNLDDVEEKCKPTFKQDRISKLWSGYCDYIVLASARKIGTAGGTGKGAAPNQHLHLQISGVKRPLSCVGLTCKFAVGVIDPFPYLLKEMSFSPAVPDKLLLSNTAEFGIVGLDAMGQPIRSEITPSISGPKGKQRFLCVSDSDDKLNFEGQFLENTTASGAKCKLWNEATASASFIKVKAKSVGNTTLSVHYTDQREVGTPLPSSPSAVAGITVEVPAARLITSPTDPALNGTMNVDFEIGIIAASTITTGGVTFRGPLSVAPYSYAGWPNAGSALHTRDQAVNGVSFTAKYAGTFSATFEVSCASAFAMEWLSNDVSDFQVQMFDENGNQIGALTFPRSPFPFVAYYGVELPKMKRVTFTTSGPEWLLIDNLKYVPGSCQ